jgi:hypothetical protein
LTVRSYVVYRDGMKRNTEPRDIADGWTLNPSTGGVVVVNHPSGAYVVADLQLAARDGGGTFKIASYRHFVENGLISDGPPAPLEWIEREANTPDKFVVILGWLHEPPPTDRPIPMRVLPDGIPLTAPKNDAFYKRVAGFVRICSENGIAYAPRLAKDNGVSESTVRGWALEARNREARRAAEARDRDQVDEVS